MNSEINLSSKRVKKVRQRQRLNRLIIKIGMVMVLVLAGAMISLSSYSLLISRSNLKLEAENKLLTKEINDLQGIESKQVYLASKLSSFKTILEGQEKHQAITETIFAILPPGTSIKDFKVEEGSINLLGTVPSFMVLSELLERINNPEGYRLPIIKARMQRVTYGKGGEVTFSLILELGNKGGQVG